MARLKIQTKQLEECPEYYIGSNGKIYREQQLKRKCRSVKWVYNEEGIPMYRFKCKDKQIIYISVEYIWDKYWPEIKENKL